MNRSRGFAEMSGFAMKSHVGVLLSLLRTVALVLRIGSLVHGSTWDSLQHRCCFYFRSIHET